jgi:hypothetical protein
VFIPTASIRGKSSDAILDAKAAERYPRLNDGVMPGNASRNWWRNNGARNVGSFLFLQRMMKPASDLLTLRGTHWRL